MDLLGRVLIGIGIALVLLGVLVLFAARVPFLDKLPGETRIERDGFTLCLPIASAIPISLLLTILVNIGLRIIRH